MLLIQPYFATGCCLNFQAAHIELQEVMHSDMSLRLDRNETISKKAAAASGTPTWSAECLWQRARLRWLHLQELSQHPSQKGAPAQSM